LEGKGGTENGWVLWNQIINLIDYKRHGPDDQWKLNSFRLRCMSWISF